MLEWIQTIDTSILLFIQEHLRLPGLNGIMVFFSLIGNAGIFWIILCGGLMCFKGDRRKIGFYTLLALGLSTGVNNLVIKHLVERVRPYETIEALTLLVGAQSSSSFPSGHTCSSFAAAYMLTRFYGRRGALAYIPAVMIAVSRPYVGVHYLSDILVGALVGTLGAVVCYSLIRKWDHRLTTPVER